MKSYTDIEQSKKLAEILPIESADGTWKQYAICGAALNVPEEMQYIHCETPFKLYSGIGCPCWSLAALLDLIPTPTLARLDDKEDGGWYRNTIKFGEDYFSYDGNYHDNPIDACVEVIKWLINNKHIKF